MIWAEPPLTIERQFSTDVTYWIRHGSLFWFQNISIAMEFSGEYITIDGHDKGVIDGQGQVWYDCTFLKSHRVFWRASTNTSTVALAIGGVFGRPIPFSLRNAKHSVAKNFWIKQSGKWQAVHSTMQSAN